MWRRLCADNVVCRTLLTRGASFRAHLNVDDPVAGQKFVEERLMSLSAEDKEDTAAFIHSMINLALCHFQQRNFIRAREVAMDAHNKVLKLKGSGSSLVYFSATTASRCCTELANAYEEHLRIVKETSHESDTLLPSASKSLRSEEAIRSLRAEAMRLEQAAKRCLNAANHGFMHADFGRRSGWDDAGPEDEPSSKPPKGSTERHIHRKRMQACCVGRVPK